MVCGGGSTRRWWHSSLRVLEDVLWRLLETFIDLFAEQPEQSRLTMAHGGSKIGTKSSIQLEADHAFSLLVPVRDLLSRARTKGRCAKGRRPRTLL